MAPGQIAGDDVEPFESAINKDFNRTWEEKYGKPSTGMDIYGNTVPVVDFDYFECNNSPSYIKRFREAYMAKRDVAKELEEDLDTLKEKNVNDDETFAREPHRAPRESDDDQREREGPFDSDDDEEDLEDEFDSAAETEDKDENFGIWSNETVGKKGLKVLLYGQSGVGKTRMAATAPSPLFLDLESGLRSTLAVKPVLRYPADPKEEVKTYPQVVEFYRLVKNTKNPKFETIVIDSLNELQVLITQNVVSRFTGVKRQYDDQLTMADYGKANRDFMKVIRLFLNLPFNIIFTAISSNKELDDDQIYPKFVGRQVGPDLQRMMDLIGYCHAKRMPDGSSQHYVSFKITPAYVAKDRLGIVGKDIPNDFNLLIQANNKEQE